MRCTAPGMTRQEWAERCFHELQTLAGALEDADGTYHNILTHRRKHGFHGQAC